jgi:hypothetical protein
MRKSLEEQLRTYTEWYVDSLEPLDSAAAPRAVAMTEVRTSSRRRPWVYALVSAAAAFVLIGGVGVIAARERANNETGPSATSGTCTETTTSADGEIVPCRPPTERDEIARQTAIELLGSERFAGLWFEDDGTTLVLGYVGEPPPLAEDFPTVDRMVQRDSSLADLEELAQQRNEAEGDSGYHWRIDIPEGTVYRVERGRELPNFGNEEFCDELRAALADGTVTWGDLTPQEIEEVGDRCAMGPPLS